MLDLASHIVESKAGHFEPERFEDQYEDALKGAAEEKAVGYKGPISNPPDPSRMTFGSDPDILEQSTNMMRDWFDTLKFPRRKFLHLVAGAAALPALSRIAWAQAYPSRAVRIIVAVPPGGPIDLGARLIGQWLSERLGQPFVVENRPGGGNNIGTEAVARAPADGYTLLVTAAAAAINATLFNKLNYNFLRDFAPVAGINHIPLILVANPSFPVASVSELIAYAKANPGKVNLATPGLATAPDLAGELLKMMTGVELSWCAIADRLRRRRT